MSIESAEISTIKDTKSKPIIPRGLIILFFDVVFTQFIKQHNVSKTALTLCHWFKISLTISDTMENIIDMSLTSLF